MIFYMTFKTFPNFRMFRIFRILGEFLELKNRIFLKSDLRIYVLVLASSLTNGDWCCCEELEIGHSTKTLL